MLKLLIGLTVLETILHIFPSFISFTINLHGFFCHIHTVHLYKYKTSSDLSGTCTHIILHRFLCLQRGWNSRALRTKREWRQQQITDDIRSMEQAAKHGALKAASLWQWNRNPGSSIFIRLAVPRLSNDVATGQILGPTFSCSLRVTFTAGPRDVYLGEAEHRDEDTWPCDSGALNAKRCLSLIKRGPDRNPVWPIYWTDEY